MNLRGYFRIARVDHWFKNVLVLPGAALAAFLSETPISEFGLPLMLGLASTCLVASASYALNEWLDADFDRFHPLKRNRPSVVGGLSSRGVYLEYSLLLAAGLGLAACISGPFFAMAALLGIMGVLYNTRPFRTKDRVYLDVLSESFNNPIRLLLGWFAVISWPLPPASLVLGYWMAGAFLMSVKRFAELRFLGSREVARQYRRSFRYYTEDTLLISTLFYASCASFFLGVFLVKYRVELLLTLPGIAVGFAWYLKIGMNADSAAQRPEYLYRETAFAAYLAFLILFVSVAFVVDIPALQWFLARVTEVGN